MEKSQIRTESLKLAFEELKFLKELGVAPLLQSQSALFDTVKQLAQKYEDAISSTQSLS